MYAKYMNVMCYGTHLACKVYVILCNKGRDLPVSKNLEKAGQSEMLSNIYQ